jgi:hypothetical protein
LKLVSDIISYSSAYKGYISVEGRKIMLKLAVKEYEIYCDKWKPKKELEHRTAICPKILRKKRVQDLSGCAVSSECRKI